MAWIDAPELGQAFGRRAKQLMSALVFGKDVELHPRGVDRYARTVAMVFVDGRDVGLELIKARPGLGLRVLPASGEPGHPSPVLGCRDCRTCIADRAVAG